MQPAKIEMLSIEIERVQRLSPAASGAQLRAAGAGRSGPQQAPLRNGNGTPAVPRKKGRRTLRRAGR